MTRATRLYISVGIVASSALTLSSCGDPYLGPVRLISTPVERRISSWFYNLRYRPPLPREVGDAGPWRGITLSDPIGIAEGRNGELYVSDRGRRGRGPFIWALRPDGVARVIAGTGYRGVPTTGVDGRESDLGLPQGLAVDKGGRIYFADSYNHMVLRIDPDGTLTRVAGTGVSGYRGDGGPAWDARLNRPFDVRIDAHGGILIVEPDNNAIRMVAEDGRIETIVGTGVPGYSGDGGPAVAAQLTQPFGVFPLADGGLLIADSDNHVVRRVDPDGKIVTIAGNGRRGYSGDGGSARDASFMKPETVVMRRRGEILVADEHSHTLRIIDLDGRVSTLTGTGQPGVSEEGTTIAEAALSDPENIHVLKDESIVVVEGDSGRLLRLTPGGTLEVLAGSDLGGLPRP